MNPSDLSRVIGDFPERKEEIVFLSNLLDTSLVPSHPILIYGPSGSGKVSICTSILDKLDTPCANILCSGYASSKQLFRAIYNAASTALLQHSSEIYTALMQKITTGSYVTAFKQEKRAKIMKQIKINNMSDLCHGLSDLMDQKPSNGLVGLFILLNSLPRADEYEKNLSHMLLNLAALSCQRIKIVAISRASGIIPTCCIPVKFSAYTDNQLQKIIIFRANREIFKGDVTANENVSIEVSVYNSLYVLF